ncbi:23S rRNA pseudouridylate synthase B [Coxiella burnetii]|uniref:Pseudouridine synthase n=1 Tax=Coxiella burnetii (strain Dugway 5J108-111) TaxID=434922 RepID=A9KG22_COXBN|nr:pseudouridine synthase [Coxiella burnetii]ABS78454.1 ribosomal large subunit pseudouridine synthase B [Coxiella burnetii Dugway 5J108-111]OYK80150.1 23S rRNA pseudouridylate synthase B [Coxiella burnetii]OYK82233.1 23S rRNA pseudouridylate synthase B [Coxiella burnetii]
MKERIQKVLARSGYGSRREIEKMIAEGRIKVNQRLAQLGDRITEQDLVYIDGQLSSLSAPEQVRVLLYHKPEGEICTRKDPEGRTTVFETLPRLKDGRWVIIGRLDINTSGLLLFTNEGELANRLMHPSAQVEREYAVRVLGAVDADMTQKLAHGVGLEDGKARFEDIVDVGGDGKNRWFHVVVVEGRHRFVRRLWESQGVKVSRLIRVRFGPIVLSKSLRRGAWKELESPEIKSLQNISIVPR